MKSGYDDVVGVRREVASECLKISTFVNNHTIQHINNAFLAFNQKIVPEQMKLSERKDQYYRKERAFNKVISQV